MWNINILFLLLICLYGKVVLAQDDCKIFDENNNDDDWNYNELFITLNDTDLKFQKIYTTVNVDDVTKMKNPYVNVKFNKNDNQLILSMEPEFSNFIKKELILKKNYANEIVFTCKSKSIEKDLSIQVTEVTNYEPVFDPSNNYNLKLQMPITSNQLIETAKFIASDYNIQETITYSFFGSECENYFEFVPQTIVHKENENKIYQSQLRTIKYVDLNKNLTCPIRVTDEKGEFSEKKLNIMVDIEISKPPNPLFKEPLYNIKYDESSVNLYLKESLYKPNVKIIKSEFSEYYDFETISKTEIQINKKGVIPDDKIENINYFTFIVEVTYDKADDSAKTVILVDLPKQTETTTIPTTTTCEPCTTIAPPVTTECPTTTCEPCITEKPPVTTECPTTTCEPCTTECPTTTCEPCITEKPTVTTECPTTTCEPCTTIAPPVTTECPTTTCEPCITEKPPVTTECPTTTCEPCTTECPTTTCEPCITEKPTVTTECPTTTCEPCTTIAPPVTTECPITCDPCTTIVPPGTSECSTTCEPCNCSTTPTVPGSSTTEISSTVDPENTSTPCAVCPTTTESNGISTCPPCICTSTEPGLITCPTIPDCPNTGTPTDSSSSTSQSSSCEPCVPDPVVRFTKKCDFYEQDPQSIGIISSFEAVSDISEDIIYSIQSATPPGNEKNFEITQDGKVNRIKELDEALYTITLNAKGKISKSEDEANIFLLIKEKLSICDDGEPKFENSIEHIHVNEELNEETILHTSENGFIYKFTDDTSIKDQEYFKLNSTHLVLKSINREDSYIKYKLSPQIQIKLKVSEQQSKYSFKYETSMKNINLTYQNDDEFSCLNIMSQTLRGDTILYLISVNDINDNDPVFDGISPIVVGYPDSEIRKFLAPPHLLQAKATDEDIGMFGKIKYSVDNQKFVIDSENGYVYVVQEIVDNTPFTITAEDINGQNGNKAYLNVKVKLLKEEHISIITMANIKFSEIEEKVNQISYETNQNVKYLTSMTIPEKTKNLKKILTAYDDNSQSENDVTIPEVQVVLYALDVNNNILSAKKLNQLMDDIDIGIDIVAKEYEKPISNIENDSTGWIAAVSTLSVLLALVIIGVLVIYTVVIRPKVMKNNSFGYTKNISNESLHVAPVETKMESTTSIADRRPTGFPIGFKMEDLDYDEYDEIDGDNKNVINEEHEEEEKEDDDDEGINDSEISSNYDSEKRSVVKFDTNVTEIEIEKL